MNAPTKVSALTWRGLLVGLVCVVVTCLTVCFAELVVGQIQIGFLQLPPVVVGMLVILIGGQRLLSRLSARLRLQSHEIFGIYVMMLLASMVSSRGLLEKIIPLLVVPNYDANATNNWQKLFFPFIKRWSVPWDPKAAPQQYAPDRFFASLKPGENIPWAIWAGPLTAWAIFVALIIGAFLCLAVLLRRQWVDNEKLAFPLVQLPLEMVKGERTGFLANRLTWAGFALSASVFAFKGLHQWYPAVPDLITDIDINQYLVEPPWNQTLFFHIYVSFAAVGFFYLLPTDLLFSLWGFFLLTKVADVVTASLGYEPEVMPMYGERLYLGYQNIGCYFVLVAYMIWAARPHLANVWRAAIGHAGREGEKGRRGGGETTARPPTLNPQPSVPEAALGVSAAQQPFTPNAQSPAPPDEILSYRAALFGLVACWLLASAWMGLLGMAYWLALFELGIMLFVVALVMARSVCESGMLMTETSFRPIDVYRMMGDVRHLGSANITSLAFLDASWMRDQRGLLLTGFLDSMKFADGVQVRRRSLLTVFVVAIVAAIAVSGYLHISLPYRIGAVSMYSYVYNGNPVWAFNDAATVLNGARPPLPWFATLDFFIGALVTVSIAGLRARLAWFPVHPLGYALCGTWTMMVFWFPCFVAWLAKIVILRYGGMRLYSRARPLFLGMVLGEFTMAVIWTIPSIFWRTPTPAFPWP